MQLLTFTLTGMDYGISLENVESIESKMNVVVVPTSPANIRGIIRLHGEILPEYEEAKTVENTVEIAVQINGKTKGTLAIGRDDAKEDVIAKAKESIADKLTGNIVKEIYVPGRILCSCHPIIPPPGSIPLSVGFEYLRQTDR